MITIKILIFFSLLRKESFMSQIERTDLKEQMESILRNHIYEYISSTENQIPDYTLLSIYQNYLDDGFLSVTSTTQDEPMMHMLTMDSLKNYSRGTSIKPGNICLNIKKLITNIPSFHEQVIVLARGMPYLKICAAIHLWKLLVETFAVEISKEQAFVIVALWKNCDYTHKISIDKGLECVNILLKKYNELALSDKKYNQILDSLESIQCLEMKDGDIYLREWISKNYIDNL